MGPRRSGTIIEDVADCTSPVAEEAGLRLDVSGRERGLPSLPTASSSARPSPISVDNASNIPSMTRAVRPVTGPPEAASPSRWPASARRSRSPLPTAAGCGATGPRAARLARFVRLEKSRSRPAAAWASAWSPAVARLHAARHPPRGQRAGAPGRASVASPPRARRSVDGKRLSFEGIGLGPTVVYDSREM